jgi:hypothetical protein
MDVVVDVRRTIVWMFECLSLKNVLRVLLSLLCFLCSPVVRGKGGCMYVSFVPHNNCIADGHSGYSFDCMPRDLHIRQRLQSIGTQSIKQFSPTNKLTPRADRGDQGKFVFIKFKR